MIGFITLAQLATRSLLRNKIRSILTMLGIVIGISSVIIMIAVGEGASVQIQERVSSMGKNMLLIMPGAASTGGLSLGAGTSPTITPEDGEAIWREVPSIRAVSPVVYTRGQIVHEGKNWSPGSIRGEGSSYLEVKDWAMEVGDFFSEDDVLTANRVCVLGLTIAENLFSGDSPVGKTVRIRNMPFSVKGVLARKGSTARGEDQDDVVILPWTTVKRVLQGSILNDVDAVIASVESPEAMDLAVIEISRLLRERHRLTEEQDNDFRILTMAEMIEVATRTARIMTYLLAAIASISLIVGGIGIMNIMLVSVAERTREIGLRMAVGARRRDILMQFLWEALAMSGVSGIVGILLGIIGAITITETMQWPTRINPNAALLALGVSVVVGVVFGLFPTLRASRMDPIVALRYE